MERNILYVCIFGFLLSGCGEYKKNGITYDDKDIYDMVKSIGTDMPNLKKQICNYMFIPTGPDARQEYDKLKYENSLEAIEDNTALDVASGSSNRATMGGAIIGAVIAELTANDVDENKVYLEVTKKIYSPSNCTFKVIDAAIEEDQTNSVSKLFTGRDEKWQNIDFEFEINDMPFDFSYERMPNGQSRNVSFSTSELMKDYK